MSSLTIPAAGDELLAALQAAPGYQLTAIGDRLGVGEQRVRHWRNRDHLHDLAPWVRREIATVLHVPHTAR